MGDKALGYDLLRQSVNLTSRKLDGNHEFERRWIPLVGPGSDASSIPSLLRSVSCGAKLISLKIMIVDYKRIS